jgi:hypothetical protein
MTGTSRDLPAAGDLGGAVAHTVLKDDGKSLLIAGEHDGCRVVIKVLRSDEELWQARFRHEIGLYQVFAGHPPPVRVPRLIYTDGCRVLVTERIPGHPLDHERYPAQPLTAATLDTVLGTITAFSGWDPPAGVLAPVFDYPDRIGRYHRAGYFDDADHAALRGLLQDLQDAGPRWQANHGDPVPANLLLAGQGGCVLIDWEFTGLFLPGFDLAMLHTLLAGTPGAQARIDAAAGEARIRAPFLLNQAMVISRELRIHAELPDGQLRDRRLSLLRPQWDAFRSRLRAWR